MARFAGVVDPSDGSFPRSTVAFCTDAICISIGSLFGCSPVTAFVESGAGIAEGGRTGLTAMTTGFLFFISLFFAPIFSNIPTWATGCALVLVSGPSDVDTTPHILIGNYRLDASCFVPWLRLIGPTQEMPSLQRSHSFSFPSATQLLMA